MKLIECVPNISEVKDPQLIQALAQILQETPHIKLLHIDAGITTNRTVYTFVGPPLFVCDAAFALIAKAVQLIDMRQHKGTHPRIGAVDVCPLVPLTGVTMEECIQLARQLAQKVGEELCVPVYLYAKAAQKPEREKLPEIRSGEYEGFFEKIKNPAWQPDFGPCLLDPKVGATVIGARDLLVAYNINLNTQDLTLVQQLAKKLRTSFRFLQTKAWWIPEFHRAQVTTNILNIHETKLHEVFIACCDEAKKLKVEVTGSEIVGLAPKQVLLEAGKYFAKENLVKVIPAKAGISQNSGDPHLRGNDFVLIQHAISALGLNDVKPFEPRSKIIEEAMKV